MLAADARTGRRHPDARFPRRVAHVDGGNVLRTGATYAGALHPAARQGHTNDFRCRAVFGSLAASTASLVTKTVVYKLIQTRRPASRVVTARRVASRTASHPPRDTITNASPTATQTRPYSHDESPNDVRLRALLDPETGRWIHSAPDRERSRCRQRSGRLSTTTYSKIGFLGTNARRSATATRSPA
jgi:hypothetical protein